MKNRLIIASIIACIAFVSCSKEDIGIPRSPITSITNFKHHLIGDIHEFEFTPISKDVEYKVRLGILGQTGSKAIHVPVEKGRFQFSNDLIKKHSTVYLFAVTKSNPSKLIASARKIVMNFPKVKNFKYTMGEKLVKFRFDKVEKAEKYLVFVNDERKLILKKDKTAFEISKEKLRKGDLIEIRAARPILGRTIIRYK